MLATEAREPLCLNRLQPPAGWTEPGPATGSVLGWLPYLWQRVLFPGYVRAGGEAPWFALPLLLVLASVLLYPFLDFRLFEPDEGRYAQIPREMWDRGDWLVPTL